MNSKLLFEQHSVLVFGEKSFIKETINICKKINFKSLFISNKFDEVCNLFSKENISIVFLNVESCNLYLIKLRELLAGKNTRYFLVFENITNELLKFNLDEYIFTPDENKTITYKPIENKPLIQKDNRYLEISLLPDRDSNRIIVEWELLARDFNRKETFEIKIEPEYIEKVKFEANLAKESFAKRLKTLSP